ncbi:MAG: hypothetical protein Q8N53_05870, partial [Longimicrobiales bacterium]|nr:hypothetical protein [Longimicrobiales bacterium]
MLVGATRQYAIEVRDGSNVVMPQYTTATWSIVGTGIATITPGGGLASCVSVGTVTVHAIGPQDGNGTNLTADVSLECVALPPTTGTLTIVKDAQPDDAQAFHFTTTGGAGLVDFNLDDDGNSSNALSNSRTFTLPAGGPYTVTEDALNGWAVSGGINCTQSGAQNSNVTGNVPSITVTVGAGGNVTCTFKNVKTTPTTGSITIVKDADPNSAQNFTFTSDQAAIQPFPLDDDADLTLSHQKVFATLPAGSYTFTETQVSGWTLSSIACTPSGSATTNLTTGAATIALTAGANIVCTFVNTAAPAPTTGSITIVKDADPNDAQNFTFTTTGAGLSGFQLDDDPPDGALPSSKTFSGLATGVPFTVTEGATAGWTLTGVTCTQSGAVGAAGASITYPALGVAVTLTEGANVVCTFVN